MDPFAYLSFLVSLVLGLGITQLLMGFSRWLEQRKAFGAYSPAIAWAAFLLLVHFQSWWSMYGMRDFIDWNFLQFSMVLLQPILLFLLAVLVFPSPTAPDQDLRANFLHQRPWFFGLFLTLLVTSLLKDVVRRGRLPEATNVGFHVAAMVVAALALASKDERLHRWIGGLALALFIVYIAVLLRQAVAMRRDPVTRSYPRRLGAPCIHDGTKPRRRAEAQGVNPTG
jgi:hypothetical protein